MTVQVKICGITDHFSLLAALQGGASWIGLVFYPPSPRAVTVTEAAALLRTIPTAFLAEIGTRIGLVGLTVDMDLSQCYSLAQKLPLTMLQAHGNESPEQIDLMRKVTGLPVMKAIKIAAEIDLHQASAYEPVADWLLYDAKPPPGPTALPGGNACAFDWRLMQTRPQSLPWMLAGGLCVETIAQATVESGARILDVSSAIERAPGIKDPVRIQNFLAMAHALP